MADSPGVIGFSKEYLEGIALFNEGKFFEAHEVWESVWLRSQGQSRLYYQALIQTAAARVHVQKGNRVGASNLHRLALEKFSRLPDCMLGLDINDFTARLSLDKNAFPKITLSG